MMSAQLEDRKARVVAASNVRQQAAGLRFVDRRRNNSEIPSKDTAEMR